ncbi:MAG: glycosyltransferase, partial [Proteobacteria bacterium]|nr:glycosyltransferase [Pseudomonadota bacterium]
RAAGSAGRVGVSAATGLVLLGLSAAEVAVRGPTLVSAGAAVLGWIACVRHRECFSAGAVLAVAFALRLPFVLGDFHSNDLHRYVWEGQVQLSGWSPYAVPPAADVLAPLRGLRFDAIAFPELTTVYPPLAQAVFALWAALGLEELGFRNAVFGVEAAAILLLVAWLWATGRPTGNAVAYAWSPVAIAAVAGGHIDPLMLLFLIGMVFAWETGRARVAAACLAAAILAKTVAVLLLPWWLLRRPRSVLAIVLPIVALGYAPYALMGAPWGSLLTFGSEFAFNASLFRLVEWGWPESAPVLVAIGVAAWSGVVAVGQPRLAAAAAWVLAGLLVLAPTVHYWYLTWFIVFLPRLLGRGEGGRPLLAWAACAVFAVPAYLAVVEGASHPERWEFLALQYAPPLLVLLAVAWRAWPPRVALAAAAGECRIDPMRVAVVIPARGEFENLERLLPAWERVGVGRIIVADTPSGDGTQALCDAQPTVDYVPVRVPGYGAAVAAGLAAAAEWDFAVVCDADDAAGPECLPAILAPFEDSRVSLVTGARTNAALQTLWQRWGNRLVTLLIALGWGRWFHDLGPLRALRLSAWLADPLQDRRFGWNVEMNVRAIERGERVVEVPIDNAARRFGENRISVGWRAALGVGGGMLLRLFRLREAACARPS